MQREQCGADSLSFNDDLRPTQRARIPKPSQTLLQTVFVDALLATRRPVVIDQLLGANAAITGVS